MNMLKQLLPFLAIFLLSITFKLIYPLNDKNIPTNKSTKPAFDQNIETKTKDHINFKNQSENNTSIINKRLAEEIENIMREGIKNSDYYTDSEYKYEYRTGNSGNYNYNYDVSGSGSNGSNVYGNIDMSGKYGSGVIYDEDGTEIDVDVLWIDYGVLEASDGYGNSYELIVD